VAIAASGYRGYFESTTVLAVLFKPNLCTLAGNHNALSSMTVKTILGFAVYREAAELPKVGVCGPLLPRRHSSAPQRTTDVAQ
jgi:hypothetical protein